MYERILILRKWEELGLKQSDKKQVREFIQFVEKNPQLGWAAFAKKFHKSFYRVFDDLIPPLVDIGDNLIILNLIRHFNLKKHRKELYLLKDIAANADPQKLRVSLEALAKLKKPSLTKVLKGRKDLPRQVNAVL